jgi:hypothetical protein
MWLMCVAMEFPWGRGVESQLPGDSRVEFLDITLKYGTSIPAICGMLSHVHHLILSVCDRRLANTVAVTCVLYYIPVSF